MDLGTHPGGIGGHTARVPPGFKMRCTSGNKRFKGNIGEGITPNNSTASKLSEAKPVLRASVLITHTLLKPAT
jgi:hypothetical protein